MKYGDDRLPQRFWDKVKVDGGSGCWLWTAYTSRKGYGQLRLGSKDCLAHRVAYEALVGEIPEGLQCDHLCRIRRCVNPEHLEPVTSRENTLRGDTVAARNAAKTHCPIGHEFSEENTRVLKGGRRECRACHRRWQREYRVRKRAREAEEEMAS
jgi:hypothetical protein